MDKTALSARLHSLANSVALTELSEDAYLDLDTIVDDFKERMDAYVEGSEDEDEEEEEVDEEDEEDDEE